MTRFATRSGFTLLEVLVALTVFALLATPLFIAQSVLLRGVSQAADAIHHLFLAENFFVEVAQKDEDKQSVTHEKKIQSPVTQLSYTRAPVDKKSSLQNFEGLASEKMVVEWDELGQKRKETFVQFVYKPERKKT